MTTNEHFQPGSGRHTGLIEDQNARLVPLRGAERREVGGSDSFVDLNPKFLGFCCGPASSCCCGCTLQFALKAFSTIGLVFGILGLMGALVSIGLSEVWASVESFVKSGLLLTFGILLWNTAGEMNPKLGRLSSYALAGVYVVDLLVIILALVVIASPSFKIQLLNDFREEFVEKEHRDPTEDESKQLQLLTSAIVGALIGSAIAAMVLEGLFYLFVYYFIWSFVVRAKRGENLLLSHGLYTLPMTQPVVNPQYGVYYPQMNGTIPANPQYFYPQPQVQLSDMQRPVSTVPV